MVVPGSASVRDIQDAAKGGTEQGHGVVVFFVRLIDLGDAPRPVLRCGCNDAEWSDHGRMPIVIFINQGVSAQPARITLEYMEWRGVAVLRLDEHYVESAPGGVV